MSDKKCRKLIEPYAQGWQASAERKPVEANPYTHDSGAHDEWIKGHEDGEQDWKALCLQEGIVDSPLL